jgi:hypothetical protein
MRLNTIMAAFFCVTIIAAILVLLAGGYIPTLNVPQANLSSDAQNVLVEDGEASPDASTGTSTPEEPAVTQVTPLQDGASLLASHCAQCHPGQWLEQISKPRSGWEKTLLQMEEMGVHLSDDEKVILLDYLAVTDEP